MKKFFALLLVFVVLTATLVSCTSTGRSVEDCCAEVISLMNDMINSEDYLKTYRLPAAYDDTITQLRSRDYSKPAAIYELDISESTWLSKEIGTANFPDELDDYVHSALFLSIASKINEKAGVDAMVVSAMFSAQKSFVCESVKENTAFLYVYEDGSAIIVTVLTGESGSIRVCGNLILNEDFNTDDASLIENSFADIGIDGVVAEKK